MEAIGELSAGQWLDIGFAGIISWCMLWGLIRGFFHEMINLVGMVTAFIVAGTFYRAAHSTSGTDFGIETVWVAQGAWYFILLVGVWVLFKLINWGVHKYAVNDESIQFKNRLTGALFGALKGGCFIGFIACFMAGVNTNKVPLGGKLQSLYENSKTITFLQDNPSIVRQFQKMALVQGASDAMIDIAARGAVEYLGIEDPPLKAKAVEALKPFLANPELFKRLHESPTAVESAKKFTANPAFARFLETSPEVRQARERKRFNGADLKEILQSKQTRLLLQDPEIRTLILALDLKQIREELGETNKKD